LVSNLPKRTPGSTNETAEASLDHQHAAMENACACVRACCRCARSRVGVRSASACVRESVWVGVLVSGGR
jgi:hypothetical protein